MSLKVVVLVVVLVIYSKFVRYVNSLILYRQVKYVAGAFNMKYVEGAF